jgi:tetratricopeptide (TPR) repeat protein
LADNDRKYEQSLRLHPDYPEARYNLGSALLQKGQINEAIQQCEEALRLQPGDADAHVVLGNAFVAKQDLDGAVSHYLKALALRPDDYEAHYNLANIFLEQRREREALVQYEEALKSAPESGKAQNGLAWILATASDQALRNGGRALRLAALAVRSLGDRDPSVLQTLGAAYAETAQFDRAIGAAQTALQLTEQQAGAAQGEELRREIRLYQSGSAYREP